MRSQPTAVHRRARGSIGVVLGLGALLAMVGAPPVPTPEVTAGAAPAVSAVSAVRVLSAEPPLQPEWVLPAAVEPTGPANEWAAALLTVLLTAPVAEGPSASAAVLPADLAAIDPRVDVRGIPARVLEAYRAAAARLAAEQPGCGVPWELIAAIGRVESGHGTFGGAAVMADGRIAPEIIGLRLDGAGPVAEIRDTDGGLLDRDTVYDRAVGPMQFIPGT